MSQWQKGKGERLWLSSAMLETKELIQFEVNGAESWFTSEAHGMAKLIRCTIERVAYE